MYQRCIFQTAKTTVVWTTGSQRIITNWKSWESFVVRLLYSMFQAMWRDTRLETHCEVNATRMFSRNEFQTSNHLQRLLVFLFFFVKHLQRNNRNKIQNKTLNIWEWLFGCRLWEYLARSRETQNIGIQALRFSFNTNVIGQKMVFPLHSRPPSPYLPPMAPFHCIKIWFSSYSGLGHLSSFGWAFEGRGRKGTIRKNFMMQNVFLLHRFLAPRASAPLLQTLRTLSLHVSPTNKNCWKGRVGWAPEQKLHASLLSQPLALHSSEK